MKKNKEIILGRKDAVWGEIEIKSDTQTLKQDMNTITQGFARFIGGVISGGGESHGANRVNGGVQSDIVNCLYGLTNLSGWSSSNSPNYKPFMIYFDYDPTPEAGYVHNKLFEDKFNRLSSTINDPQRYDFDHFGNANIPVTWDEQNKCIRISKSFKNITNENKYIKRIYLMCLGGFRWYEASTVNSNKNLIIAMDEVAFEVLPDQQINISFIIKLDGFVNNGERWLRVLLGNGLALSNQADVFRYIDSSAQYRNLIRTDGVVINTNQTLGSIDNLFKSMVLSTNYMRIGYNNKPVEYLDYNLTEQATNTSYSNYFVDYLAYNEEEQFYDVKLSTIATNTSSVAQSYNEIGVFRARKDGHGTNYVPVLSHRAVLDEPVELLPDQSAEFSITFRCYCVHKPTTRVNVSADPVDYMNWITPSGAFPQNATAKFQTAPKAGKKLLHWEVTIPNLTTQEIPSELIELQIGTEEEINLVAKFIDEE